MRVLVVALAIAVLTALSAAAQSCRQALVLALDVSGSVNAREFAQQIDGLASALDAPDVRALILDGADAPVSLAVFEWSSQNHQYLIQPWIALRNEAALDAAIARIRSHRKVRAGLKTAIGTAMNFAAGLLGEVAHCWKRTIDVSGDGENNIGPLPQQIYALAGFGGITVNALVVAEPPGSVTGSSRGMTRLELLHYFEAEVIHGGDAFAMIAEGYQDYARAMRRKLLKELALPVFGRAGPDGGPPGMDAPERRERL